MLIMNKKSLVKEMAAQNGLTQKKNKAVVDAIIEIANEELGNGGSIKLVNFGTFKVVQRKERQGINPQTLEKMTIPAKQVVKFKAGKGLAEVVNA
ncbi:MAG: integration host factor [Candidatus Lokiarchaeota archaeon]|nr:integration host factor [Candidatus Lokiarchaeota archaeon]